MSRNADFTNSVVAKKLAKQVKLIRVLAGLTQTQLSQKSGVSQTTINFLENCKNKPTATTLIKIANACGSPPMELLSILDEPIGD